MGKVFQDKICDICGIQGKVIETWGKKYCQACYDKKPKRGKGNSGMLPTRELDLLELRFDTILKLERTTKGNKTFATLYLEHYPASKGIVGRQLNYFIKKNCEIIGIVGVNSPPLGYKKFNEYFGENFTEKNWVNNNVFRIIKTSKNLGTKVLKLLRQQAKYDYELQYGDKLIGLITFVEPPRTGAVYKADNWEFLGQTQGKKCTRRGDHGKWLNKEWSEGTKKLIFAKKLCAE